MSRVWILYHSANASNENFEAKRLVEEFTDMGINTEVMQPKNFDIITSRRNPKSIRYQGETVKLPDAVLVRTGSATNYFTTALLRQIEGFDVPVINSTESILKCKDKMWSGHLLAQHKIPVPRTMLVNFPVSGSIVEDEIGFPCVVKLVSGSQGKGVYKCSDRKFFDDLMELIQNLKTKKSIMVQEFITDGEQPADIRAWVIGGKTRVAMKRTAPEGDFRANISNGGHGEKYPLTDELCDIAERTAALFGLDIAGIDLLSNGKHFRVCEANSSPGFEGIDQYCGTNMAKEIAKYVEQYLTK